MQKSCRIFLYYEYNMYICKLQTHSKKERHTQINQIIFYEKVF